MRARTVYKFMKGERFWFDDIYDIQGLAGGDWWEHATASNEADADDVFSEAVICTRSVKITIIVETEEC